MFVDGRGVGNGEELEADVAIVGAGAAGITLGRALGTAGMRVLVIESGDVRLDRATQDLYAGESVGLPYFPLTAARLRYFGGSTNHWAGTCRPFGQFDLESHAWIPNSGWPIAIGDLDAYYPEAGEICGLRSAEWETESWIQASAPAPLPLDGERMASRVAQNVRAARRRFGRNYRDELRSSRMTTVLMNTNLVEIEVGEAADEVTGLQLRTLSGVALRAVARAYVIATGGIENARLLLASNSRLPAGLGNGNDLVGRFFLEHPRFVGAVLVPFDQGLDLRFYQPHDAANSRITGYFALPESVRAAEGLADVQLRLDPQYARFYERAEDSDDVDALRSLLGRARDDADFEDLEDVADDLTSWRRFLALGAPLPVPLPDAAGAFLAASPEERQALIPAVLGDIATVVYGKAVGGIPLDSVEILTRIDPMPNPDSRVRLGAERDALGMPRAELDWQLSRSDRESVVRAVELFATEVGRAGIGRVRAVLEPDGDRWPDDLEGGWHHMGTTRMHDDARHGVVDRDCRVHGMRNLYVAGSSVFTTAGSATPTLTIVALALRLAEHLEAAAR